MRDPMVPAPSTATRWIGFTPGVYRERRDCGSTGNETGPPLFRWHGPVFGESLMDVGYGDGIA